MYEARSCQVNQTPSNDGSFLPPNHLRPRYDVCCTSPQVCKGCNVNEALGELAVVCALKDEQKFKETWTRALCVCLSGRTERREQAASES